MAPGVQFLQSVVTINGSTGSATTSIGTALANNTWHHIAMTVQKGAGGANTGTVKVYIDGVEKQSFTGPTTTNQEAANVQSDTTWGVGAAIEDDGNGGGFVSGFFDEVAFWDTVLPADDIGTIYNSGNGTSDLSSDFGSYNDALQTCSTTLGLRTITQIPKEMLLMPQQKEALCSAHHQHHLDHEEVRYRKQVRTGRSRIYHRLLSAVILKQVSFEVQS